MDKTLKQKNKPLLVATVLVNVFFYFVVYKFGFDVNQILEYSRKIENFLPLTIITIFVGILNSQTSHINKARIVFWKYKAPLAGCRAFSEYIAIDDRINKVVLESIQAPLPTDPRQQNELWYAWYREVQNEPSIKQSHQEYLFTRDYSTISFILLFCFTLLAIVQFDSLIKVLFFSGCLLLQYLFVRNAAKNHGIRFVCNVLAAKSAPIDKRKEEK